MSSKDALMAYLSGELTKDQTVVVLKTKKAKKKK